MLQTDMLNYVMLRTEQSLYTTFVLPAGRN
jgi:hypothetical protein